MFLVFAAVTAYRQLTEQRQRRQITGIFKQYVSPAVVDLVAQNPALAGLGGQQRRITSFFSDLEGFTSLAEKLGAEGTVRLLNRYLDRVGEILVSRYEGTLSKYEGDAVFAFFGAPAPQTDQAARAISAAVDCQALLPEFNRQLAREGLLPDGAGLSARIGITAGEAFVGNMGSTQKVAYTAIGDSVNLASRLEGANKFFASRILVNRAAWNDRGEGILGRAMGKILVVGKAEPVEVYEPLARLSEADDKLRRLAEEFSRGVEKFSAGDFSAAQSIFQAVLEIRDDGPTRAYLRLCGQALSDEKLRTAFDGVIRLTEK
jgi:adenylate cyclase